MNATLSITPEQQEAIESLIEPYIPEKQDNENFIVVYDMVVDDDESILYKIYPDGSCTITE